MADPAFELFVITSVAGVGHFLHDEYFHLLLKIEWAAKLQRLGFSGADALAEIREIFASNREGGAGHHATAIGPKNHSPQNRREIDRRGIERKELRGLAGSLD